MKKGKRPQGPTLDFPPPPLSGKDLEAIMNHTAANIRLLGEDTTREGLKDTPRRVAKAMQFLTSGYRTDVDQIIGKALFKAESSDLVIVRDIELFSMCEHHMLPFWGKAHVAYIPNGKIIGLSKIPRIVDAFARRLQVQERLTAQISETLMERLGAMGVAVIIEAVHLCMMMRGVEKQNSYTITSSMLGVFRTDATTRKELLHLLGGLGSVKR
ncbi:MAG: GTP cyclohydrolase I FolE [Bdellovibrionales bacterium]|nr:GTP cyclohydrolase I FolE [Bdellovibrionales bacterium]